MKFELCSATVRLGGDVRFTVLKHNITPPEVLVLRRVQIADDAVVDVIITGEVERTAREEMQRLAARYKAKPVQELFPANPTLPATFADIDVTPKDVRKPETKEKEEDHKKRGRPRKHEPDDEPVARAERGDEPEKTSEL